MPLLDSFTVDHTRMNAPAVRVAKTMQTPKGTPLLSSIYALLHQTKISFQRKASIH